MKNHFVEYLHQLEKWCPDVMSILDAEIWDKQDYPEHTKEEARQHALNLVEGWIEDFQSIKTALSSPAIPGHKTTAI